MHFDLRVVFRDALKAVFALVFLGGEVAFNLIFGLLQFVEVLSVRVDFVLQIDQFLRFLRFY